jgi:hypothetical protein
MLLSLNSLLLSLLLHLESNSTLVEYSMTSPAVALHSTTVLLTLVTALMLLQASNSTKLEIHGALLGVNTDTSVWSDPLLSLRVLAV